MRTVSFVVRPTYRITHLDACDSTKREAWLEWRKQLKTVPTSSTLCSYFGYGHDSLNKVIRERINPQEQPTDQKPSYSDIFLEKAKKYGTDNEPKAKELFQKHVDRNGGGFYVKVEDGEISYHTKIEYGDESVQVICTPDSLYLFRSHEWFGRLVVEFKCPFKVVNERGNNCISLVANQFIEKNPIGKENAFVQAATYCMSIPADMFYTVFYFTDGVDEECIVVYRYKSTPELFHAIFNALENTGLYLQEFEKDPSSKKQYRVATANKVSLKKIMRHCYLGCELASGDDFICDLQEENSKQHE